MNDRAYQLNADEVELICVVLGAYAANLMSDVNLSRSSLETHFHRINDLIQKFGMEEVGDNSEQA